MASRLSDRRKAMLTSLAMYVVSGLVIFTITRLALEEVGVSGWHVTAISLLVMIVALELLIHVGWLTRPVQADDADGD